MESKLTRVSLDMTNWANELELEHCGNPYRLDLGKTTVIIDKPERPIPLASLGSGANWVGVHLITYFALHKSFIENKRPIPRFIFIDQPSQVFFPPENEKQGQDWESIKRLYQFIFDINTKLNGQLQIIIVDHANLDNKEFADAIIENWHHDKNLIPSDWYL